MTGYDEGWDILEAPEPDEGEPEPTGPPPRPDYVIMEVTSENGIKQSFSIMSGYSVRLQLNAVIEGDGPIRMTTLPVSIRVRLS